MASLGLSTQPYISPEDFRCRRPSNGAPAVGAEFESRRWPATTRLDGQTFDIAFENAWNIRHHFHPGAPMTWTLLNDTGEVGSGTVLVHPVQVREDIYAVTFRKLAPVEDLLLVLDMDQKRPLAAVTTFGPDHYQGSETEPLESRTQFLSGGIWDGPLIKLEPSDVLVSQRAVHVYSPYQAYEHIYLSKHTAVWQCLVGPEHGETDVAETAAYVFADDLIVINWHERGAAADGVLVIDRRAHRTTGRLSGSEGMLVMGAHSYFLDPLSYPSVRDLNLA